MAEQNNSLDGYLDQAKQLVGHIESGDRNAAVSALESLSDMRETHLFTELGKLTRELHDTLNGFRADAQLAEMAEKEFPNAKERLNHVITMTEEAAGTTLTAVEESIPIATKIENDATRFSEAWERFRGRKMSVAEFRELSTELDSFLEVLASDSETLQGRLNEILMAQGYQDLTGQIIRQVIQLVQDVEEGLVEMIRISGGYHPAPEQKEDGAEAKKAAPEKKDPNKGYGPQLAGIDDTSEVLSSQDDVDELLSSLGF